MIKKLLKLPAEDWLDFIALIIMAGLLVSTLGLACVGFHGAEACFN
jgi:hypothetical protein